MKEGLKHKKLIYPEYIDLFKIQLFTENLFPIMYHTYLIKEERKENIEIIDEIHDYIFEILIQIYLNGIESEYGLSDFLYFLDTFNWYIYEQKDKFIKNNKKEEIQKLKQFIYFFINSLEQKITKYESKPQNINKKLNDSFLNIYTKAIIGKKEFKLDTFYSQLISTFKKSKYFQNLLNQMNYQNYDYLIIKVFLIYFEMCIKDLSHFDVISSDYVILISFCILLCTIDNYSYSKSKLNKFYIDLILLSIKSLFLSFKLENNINTELIKVFILIMSILYYYYKEMNCLIIFLKGGKIDTHFSNFMNLFKKYYNTKNIKNYKDEIINIIKTNDIDFLKDTHIRQLGTTLRFQYIVETIFSKEYRLNFEYFKIENRILEKFEIVK